MNIFEKAMRERYPLPEWALFFEVSNSTGASAGRRADAIAVNCYPSRGLSVHGFEFKSFRSDWLRELKNPDKSVDVQQYCDYWWVITTKGIVNDGELPATWGLIELTEGGKTRMRVEAPKLQAVPISRGFMASVLRSASKLDDNKIRVAVDAARARFQQEANDEVRRRLAQRRDEAAEIEHKIKDIKERTGIDLEGWTPPKNVARAIQFAINTDSQRARGIADALDQMENISKKIREALPLLGAEPREDG